MHPELLSEDSEEQTPCEREPQNHARRSRMRETQSLRSRDLRDDLSLQRTIGCAGTSTALAHFRRPLSHPTPDLDLPRMLPKLEQIPPDVANRAMRGQQMTSTMITSPLARFEAAA